MHVMPALFERMASDFRRQACFAAVVFQPSSR
jgi:hypothetical protein